ncbi:hypothetical protein BC936DRAFT_145605 [Jimgerdemannia flammicorona]|uniref:Serine-threonine/tyrosine-protein kinase catalytic domain-containing protein n=1 Tax=Jimgerdemannia flammicorona TaxID=994334 RepID=A0A433DNB4_9FUNG|nr:hypothetical protein BC936DRAFT_145605 [Jimgerdemannia flammicorona]
MREDPIPGMPNVLADIIRECWDLDPLKRPAMEDVSNRLHRSYSDSFKRFSKETKAFIEGQAAAHQQALAAGGEGAGDDDSDGGWEPASRSHYYPLSQLNEFNEHVD